MPKSTEHHRDERMVAGPTPFSYAYIDESDEAEIAFLHIADVEGVEASEPLPHLLIPKCQEETYAVPKQTDVLVGQALQCLTPKERYCDNQLLVISTPFTHAYDNTHLHGGGML